MQNTGPNPAPFFDDAEFSMLSRMSDAQRTAYALQRKDSLNALVLCLFLGGFGAHRFYLKQSGLGMLYVLSFWTLIPVVISLLELFVMADRTRAYNLNVARDILYGYEDERTVSPSAGINEEAQQSLPEYQYRMQLPEVEMQ